MRTLASPFGNSFDIVMRDAPEPPSRVRVQPVPLDQAAEPPPEIYEVEGSITETAVLRGYRNERLCCRFRSAADNLSGDEIILEVDELEQPVFFLTNLGKGRWQVNAIVPELPPGAHQVRVRTVRSAFSAPAGFQFDPEQFP